MAEKLDMEVEKEEPKVESVKLEEEGVPKRIHHSVDYFMGYKAGWETAKKNVLRKLSQSGGSIEQKSIENKLVVKKKSKKEDEEMIFWVGILGAVVLGGILFVFFSERNRERSQPS